MKLKGIELKGTYKVEFYDRRFGVYNDKGKAIYYEDCNGYWAKWEYDERDNLIYCEDSNGYWAKREYDKRDNLIYYEDSNGCVADKRVKELTIDEIEKLLGYKIKIKGELR